MTARHRLARILHLLAARLDPVKASNSTITVAVKVDASQAEDAMARLRRQAQSLASATEDAQRVINKMPLNPADQRAVANAISRITAAGYMPKIHARGTHLQIVTLSCGLVDFWPTTGRWWIARGQVKGRGLKELLERITGGQP